MRVRWLLLLLVLPCNAGLLYAQSDQPVSLTIADPFIELHTGPGSRYPIFHVIDRDQQIVVLKRKTRWYKIRAENGKNGWASREQMQLTLLPSGEQLKFAEDNQDAFVQRQWEIGATTVELKNAPILSLYGAYAFTQNLFTEFSLGYSVGNVSSSNIYKLNLLMQPFPEWSYSPFFTLGMGTIQVKPNATLVDPTDKKNSMSQVGFGFKTYLSRQFILRFEINEYIIFSANNDKNENEDIAEWKIGFAIFF